MSKFIQSRIFNYFNLLTAWNVILQNNFPDGNIDFDMTPGFAGPSDQFVQNYVRDAIAGFDSNFNEHIGWIVYIKPFATVTLHLHHGDIHSSLELRYLYICDHEIPGAGIYWG